MTGAESVAYYANALDLVCDMLRTLKPEQFPERAPKLIAIIANAAHQLRAEPGVSPALLRLAKMGATWQHDKAWAKGLGPEYGHKYFGLEVCQHPDCVLVRAALVAPAESGEQK